MVCMSSVAGTEALGHPSVSFGYRYVAWAQDDSLGDMRLSQVSFPFQGSGHFGARWDYSFGMTGAVSRMKESGVSLFHLSGPTSPDMDVRWHTRNSGSMVQVTVSSPVGSTRRTR